MFERHVLKVESQISREARVARREERCFSFPQLPASSPPPPRRAISLTEVLIAMGILTVGLLGVASVFPVGGWYMQRAEIADRGSAIAQSVMSDLVARGMLNPGSWFVMVPNASNGTATQPNYLFSGVDGKYAPVVHPAGSTSVDATFTRPFAEALSQGLKVNADPVILTKQFGSAFVIDPMYVAAASRPVSDRNNDSAYAFPASAHYTHPWPGSTYYGTSAWDPWRAASNSLTGDKTWPIRRVTFQQPSGWPLDKALAEGIARIGDDLVTDLPARDDRPASQKWDVDSTSGAPMARQWTGDYSWVASVTPTTNAARNGMAHNPEGFDYDVSVVVFYKRALPSTVPLLPQDVVDAAAHERMVGAKIISTGTSGGQLLLSAITNSSGVTDITDANGKSISPFDQLKVGQWIMLCGPHPNSSTSEPRFVLNWYQVLSIEGANTRLNTYGTDTPAPAATEPDRRLITVRGTQWPWQPSTSTGYAASPATVSDDLCVGIFKGAVAVHSKTMRLESLAGGSFGSGMTPFTPPGVTPGSISRD
jgi:hypothetical protein